MQPVAWAIDVNGCRPKPDLQVFDLGRGVRETETVELWRPECRGQLQSEETREWRAQIHRRDVSFDTDCVEAHLCRMELCGPALRVCV